MKILITHIRFFDDHNYSVIYNFLIRNILIHNNTSLFVISSLRRIVENNNSRNKINT